jgi:hypothetical protein
MGLFTTISEACERLVSLVIRREYRGVSPSKVGNSLVQEMSRRRRPQPGGFSVPGSYLVYFGRDDFYAIKPDEYAYVCELVGVLMEHASQLQYIPEGRVNISFELDESFRRGQFAVYGRFKEELEHIGDGTDVNQEHTGTNVETCQDNALSIKEFSPECERVTQHDEEEKSIPDDAATIVVRPESVSLAALRIIEGSHVNTEFELSDHAVSIGRSAVCDVQLEDNTVSRIHAYMRISGEGYTISDFNSKNGTYVNDKKVCEVVLTHGDRIRVGRTLLLFEVKHG